VRRDFDALEAQRFKASTLLDHGLSEGARQLASIGGRWIGGCGSW